MAYPNWIYSLFSFIGFVLVTIPFPWHLEAWNTGTCLYMAWTGISCLIQFINSVVWTGNAYNPVPVWCDITTRIMVGAAVAIPAASLCINRRLYYIARAKSVTHSKAEKRRGVMVDLAIGIGIPVAEMILAYTTQGHRYDIYEDIGCFPNIYSTWVAVLVVYLAPIVIGLVSLVYCTLSIKALNECRTQIKAILSSNSNLSASRYFRLMLLAGTEILCTTSIACYALYLNLSSPLEPYISWENVHVGFSRVDQYPALEWKSVPVWNSSLELTRWGPIICAFIFFAFFGFADEARKNYRSAFDSVAKRVGYTNTGSGIFSFNGSRSKSGASMNGTTGSLPVYVHSEVLRKKDSIGTFSDMSVSLNDVGGALKSEKDPNSHKELRVVPALAYESITLPDVGGVLADYNPRSYSPPPSSGSSSASSMNSPIAPPEQACTRPVSTIEISSIRRESYVNTIVIPETPMFAPRHPTDTPSSVTRGSLDMV